MNRYVDEYVLPLPKDKIDDYRKLAELSGKLWREHGALQFTECIADDVKPGKITSFPQSVDLKPNETVIVGQIVFESRQHRDRVNERVMKDPRFVGMDPKTMPFDAKRMFWGGFETLIEI
jgi:uncharacterized protein YbaA (DUF1428 family)